MEYLYHGSDKKLNIGDKLLCHKQYNHNMDGTVTAVFATSLLDRAKYFGIVRCLFKGSTNGFRAKYDKKILSTVMPANIKNKFFVYVVDPCGFETDAENEFFCRCDTEIRDVMEFDLIDVLNQEGWEIYKIPELDRNMSVQEKKRQILHYKNSEMARRLDISELLNNQNRK